MKTIEALIRENGSTLNGVTVMYQYSEEYEMHMLQILPSDKLNDEVIFESIHKIIDKYNESFPLDSVYLVMPDSRLKVTNASYVFESETIHNTVENVNHFYSFDQMINTQKVKLLEETVQRLYSKTTKQATGSELYVGESNYAMAA